MLFKLTILCIVCVRCALSYKWPDINKQSSKWCLVSLVWIMQGVLDIGDDRLLQCV